MDYLDWAALVLGVGPIVSGARAIRRRQAHVPEERTGPSAVRLGWVWIALGTLFAAGAIFEIGTLKALFRLFLEAAN